MNNWDAARKMNQMLSVFKKPKYLDEKLASAQLAAKAVSPSSPMAALALSNSLIPKDPAFLQQNLVFRKLPDLEDMKASLMKMNVQPSNGPLTKLIEEIQDVVIKQQEYVAELKDIFSKNLEIAGKSLEEERKQNAFLFESAKKNQRDAYINRLSLIGTWFGILVAIVIGLITC